MKFTHQELFDKAWHAIHKQGVPSVAACGSQCMYQGPNGTSCAFGHLVPEELRYLLTENQTADAQFNIPEIGNYFGVSAWSAGSFFLHLQTAHDGAAQSSSINTHRDFMDLFRMNMHEVARVYELTAPEVSDV